MRYLVKKDKKHRLNFFKTEKFYLYYRSIWLNQMLPYYIRLYFFFKIFKHYEKNGSLIRIHNRCVLSGRGHSIYRFCRLSRIRFREMVRLGLFSGIKKASW